MTTEIPKTIDVAVVGGGPAGLMATETLQAAGLSVHLFDAMPSVGRKFLLAGKGGLNLTHSEDAERFAGRYGARRDRIAGWLREDLDASALRDWAHGLGVETFVGTSGRVFPKDMKAAPLLRAWLTRLRHPAQGQAVQLHMRHRWTGWQDGALAFDTPQGHLQVAAKATVLALGGGSWARLGSDGAWLPLLADKGVALTPLLPSNCGFDVRPAWTEYFSSRFAGQPFKSVALSFQDFQRKGEFVATASGVEGSLIYAASSRLRDAIVQTGSATFHLDLLPDLSPQRVLAEVSHPRGSRSLSNHLKSRLHLDGIKMALLHELLSKAQRESPALLASAIKALPLTLGAARPIDESISSAGGVLLEGMTPDLMLKGMPGVFCAGEMLDWEAPTGGYLLQACFASGARAGKAAARFVQQAA